MRFISISEFFFSISLTSFVFFINQVNSASLTNLVSHASSSIKNQKISQGTIKKSCENILIDFSNKDVLLDCNEFVSYQIDDRILCRMALDPSGKLEEEPSLDQSNLFVALPVQNLQGKKHKMNSYSPPLYEFRSSLEKGYEFLLIHVEIWKKITEFDSSHSQRGNKLLSPKIEISYSSCEEPDQQYKTQQHEIKHFHQTKYPSWISFNFNATIKIIICEATGQLHISLIDQLHEEKSILINSIQVIQVNSYNNNNNNDEGNTDQTIIECGDPTLQFDIQILSCVRTIDSRCSPLTLEDIASHSCVQSCSRGKYEFMLSDGYLFCISGFSTCDSNPLINYCQICDQHAIICLECLPGFCIGKDAQNNRRCIPEISKTNATKLKLNRILGTPIRCKRPMCEECIGGFCMKCRSPLLSVHGVCSGCPRGYEIDTSTQDPYCRKSIDRFACSNYSEAKSTCLGCFPGTFLENSCNQHKYCLLDSQYDTISIGVQSCGTCTDFDVKCSKCTSENQCIKCFDNWKLAIAVYGEISPQTLCYENCTTGFYEDAYGFCAPCGIMCDFCTKDSLECFSCAVEYSVDIAYSLKYPNRRQRCILTAASSFLNNCEQQESTGSGFVCTTCMTGHTPIEGICIKCGIGCLECDANLFCSVCWDYSSSSVCPPLDCGLGYFMNENMECTQCIQPFMCMECWNAMTCSICKPGFVLENDLCAACTENCNMCVDANTCISCNQGYYINPSTGSCQTNDLGCAENEYYSGSACTPCNSSCLHCSDSKYCTSCADGDPRNGRCITCIAGEFLSEIDYTCKECPSNCLLCQPLTGCGECRAGYYNSKELNSCLMISICGDGDKVNPIVLSSSGLVGSKTCDDGNSTNGDGCNSDCQIEEDYECLDSSNEPDILKSVCSQKALGINEMTLSSRINGSNLNPIITLQFQFLLVESDATRRALGFGEQEMSRQRVLDGNVVALQKVISSSMVVDISETSADAYSYSVVGVASDFKSCDIEFQAKRNIVNKILVISFTETFVNANQLKRSSAQIEFPETRPISMSEKLAGDAAAVIGQVASSAVLISIIPVILFSKFSFLFNALDLFQMIYYLKFLAIRLPYNIDQFLEIMSNFKVPYSMNFISWFLEANPVESAADVPRKYDEEKITAVFLENVGDHFSQVLVILAAHMLIFGFVYSSKKFILTAREKQQSPSTISSVSDFLESKLISSWQWGWYLDKCWEMYLSVVVSCMLQFYGMYMHDAQSVINGILFIVSIVAVLATPVLFAVVIYMNRRTLHQKETKDKWGMLYEGLRIQNEDQIAPASAVSVASNSRSSLVDNQLDASIGSQAVCTSTKVMQVFEEKEKKRESLKFQACKYFYIALYFRKILFGVILVGFYDFPLVSLILIDILNGIIVVFLAFVKPFEKKSVAWKSLACELFMIIAQLSLKFIIEDTEDTDESERNLIGWVFVSACILILTIQMVFVLSNLFRDILKKVKEFLAKKKEPEKPELNEKQSQKQKQQEDELEKQERKIKDKSEDDIEEISLKKGSNNSEGNKDDSQKLCLKKENFNEQFEFSNSELVPKNLLKSQQLSEQVNQLITKNQSEKHLELVENNDLSPSVVQRQSLSRNVSLSLQTPRN